MRYILNRIFKNIPILNSIWSIFLEKIDFAYYNKHCKDYKVIPFGDYCLPRVITTVNRLKPCKKYGEVSYPFDLCFSNFSSNVELLSTNFKNFFQNLEFDKNFGFWKKNNMNMKFIHDNFDIKDFTIRYKNRINNLYEALNNKTIHLYFLVATKSIIPNDTLELFIKLVNKYRRDETFDLIIINQTNKIQTSNYKNIHFINLKNGTCFDYINKKGDWVGELKKQKTIQSRIFNYKIASKLSKMIKCNKNSN